MWQYIVLTIAILSAVGYVIYRTWQSFRAASNPCHGCSGCSINKQLKVKQKGKQKHLCSK
ncbi:FeoB-associated Cys-rich membrane protein [uncultured Prevotella sp.]|nr:FeoB-associated Cys-rich membrane protein [uncultured Prevotella sp.]